MKRLKRWLSALLVLCLSLSMVPIRAEAIEYSNYTGVDFKNANISEQRKTALTKAMQMVTVKWTCPADFPTWRSSKGVLNTVVATDGTSSTKFVKGKTYTGIPYSMADHTYDDVAWANALSSGKITTSYMTGSYYGNGDTTAHGSDCSYFVYLALKAANAGSITYQNTVAMLDSSLYSKITWEELKPADLFLKNGHVMMFVGMSGSNYAVFESDAGDSKCSYNVYTKSQLSSYSCYRYNHFADGDNSPSTNLPFGYVDSITTDVKKIIVEGWAADADDFSRAVDIHVWIGDMCVGTGTANQYRQDIQDGQGIGAYHGFRFECDIPDEYTGQQTVNVFAIDAESANNNPLLRAVSVNIPSKCSCSPSFGGTYVTTAEVTLHSGHGSQFNRMATIPAGTTLTLSKAKGFGADHWGHTTYNGISGYVRMEHVHVNLGNDFYAYIIQSEPWKHLTNDEPNVSLRTGTGAKNQVWHFLRQSDGSYKIVSVLDGTCLDVQDASTASGANVQTHADNGSNAQRWLLGGSSGQYIIGSKCAITVMDVTDNNSADGTNIQMHTFTGDPCQRFSIWKLDDYDTTIPPLPAITLSASAMDMHAENYYLGESVTVSWHAENSDSYWLQIRNDEDGTYVINERVTYSSYTFTPSAMGSYTVSMRAYNEAGDAGKVSRSFRVRGIIADSWVSETALGEEKTLVPAGTQLYYNYKLFDPLTGDMLYTYSDKDYDVTLSVWGEDDTLIARKMFTNEDQQSMAFQCDEPGSYSAEISLPSGTYHTDFIVYGPPKTPLIGLSESDQQMHDGNYYLGEQVTISWNTGNATSYWLQIRTGDADTILVNEPLEAASYTFTPEAMGSYTVAVRAYNAAGESEKATCTFRVRGIIGDTWMSAEQYGAEQTLFDSGDTAYFNFRIFDPATDELLYTYSDHTTTTELAIIAPDGRVVTEASYENDDQDSIRFVCEDPGVYTAKVVFTGKTYTSQFTVNAVSHDVASGWSGALTWVLTDDGILTFSGTGAMKNYTYKSEMPWYSYRDQITSVVLESGVTSIGDYAFYGMPALKSVEIPATVISIGDYAFKNSSSLTGVELPANLTKLGDSAFYACTSLTSIEIPAKLYTIKPYTFKNCTALTEVTFHEGNLQKISDGAFYNTALTELNLPDCLDIVDVYAFKNCAKLTSIELGSGLTELREAVFYGSAIPAITIPEGITKIGPYAFKNCVKLENIDLPESLTSVGEASFYACTALESLELPDKVTKIGNYAFRKCAALVDVQFGSGLTTIGESSFYGCEGLIYLDIPENVTTIQGYAFKGCTDMEIVNLPDSLTTLGDSAFHTCTSLSEIVIPSSVTKIGEYCFSGSTGVRCITFEGDAPTIATGAFNKLTATAYYTGGNATWTSANMLNYGGEITWTAL